MQTVPTEAVVGVTAGAEVEGQGPTQQVKVTTSSLSPATTGHLVDSDVTLVSTGMCLGACVCVCVCVEGVCVLRVCICVCVF